MTARDRERLEVDHRFAFHRASTEEKQAAHGTVRQITGDAARQLVEVLPDGREKSLALTKLEEAMFWANAALARATDNQVDAAQRQAADMQRPDGAPV
jgi:hypothetical protein